MYCPKCGADIAHEQVCPYCGARSASEETNSLAIVGFVLSFFISLAGLICSAIALKKANTEYGGNGKGLATAGVVISTLALIAEIIGVIIVIAFFGTIMAIIADMPATPDPHLATLLLLV